MGEPDLLTLSPIQTRHTLLSFLNHSRDFRRRTPLPKMRDKIRGRSVERKPSSAKASRRAPSQSSGVRTKYDEEENCELSGLQRLRRYTSNPFLFTRNADSRKKTEAEKESEALGEAFSEYEYIRFAFSDINGVHRTKLIPARHARSMLNRGGTGIYSGR